MEVRKMAVITAKEEQETLQQKINELELKVHLLEKAVEFLAQRIDDTEAELFGTGRASYLLKQLLQK
jgi:hypothetical protein